MKKLALAMAAATTLSVTPAIAKESPSEVRIGVLDVKSEDLISHKDNVSLEYREYNREDRKSARWMTSSGFDHGQLVVSTFLDQMRQIDKNVPVKIYAANIFEEKGAASMNEMLSAQPSKRTLSVSWEGAEKALDWFKENDVKVVLTSFTASDSESLRSFMKKANAMGMTIFASAGNAVGGNIYPAAYPETISVSGDEKTIAFRNDPSVSKWVDFVTDGRTPIAAGREDVGSSFAVSRAAALGAWVAAKDPSADTRKISEAVKSFGDAKEYKIKGQMVTVRYLDERQSAQRARLEHSVTAESSAVPVKIPTRTIAMQTASGMAQ